MFGGGRRRCVREGKEVDWLWWWWWWWTRERRWNVMSTERGNGQEKGTLASIIPGTLLETPGIPYLIIIDDSKNP